MGSVWYIVQASLNSLFHIILFLQVTLQPLRHHQRMRQAHWALRHQSLCPLHALCSPCPLHTLCSPPPLWALLLRALESRGCQRNRRQGPGLQGFEPALVHLTQGPEHTICMSGVVPVGQPRNAPTLCFVGVCSFFANPQNPLKCQQPSLGTLLINLIFLAKQMSFSLVFICFAAPIT